MLAQSFVASSEYNELPPEVPRPTPKVLTKEQQAAIEAERIKKSGCLYPINDHGHRRYLNTCDGPNNAYISNADGTYVHDARRDAMAKSCFATLPANADVAAVAKYTKEGADVIMRSIKAEDMSGKEQARLHSSMKSILSAHHKRDKREYRTLFARAFVHRDTTGQASADVVLDSLVGAVVDAADSKTRIGCRCSPLAPRAGRSESRWRLGLPARRRLWRQQDCSSGSSKRCEVSC